MTRLATALALFGAVLCRLWAPHASFAASPSFSLNQCVALALEKNRDILRAREKLARLEGQIWEVRSQTYPKVGFEAGYQRLYDRSVLDNFGGFITPKQTDNYSVRTTLNQILFSWGKASNAVQIAEISRVQAEHDLRAAERDVKLQVHDAYYGLLLAQALVGVAEETLGQRERHLDVARKRFEAGVVNEFEVIRARVDVANARTPIIQAQNRVRRARAQLNNLLARDQGVPIEIEGMLEYVPLAGLTLEGVAERAVRQRPEIASLRAAHEIAAKNLAIARAENKPTVNMQAEYGFATQEAANLGPSRERWLAGVVVGFPIFDGWRTRGLVLQAESQVRDIDLAKAQIQDSIALEAQVDLDDLLQAAEVIEASGLNIEQAQEALTLAETSYRYGVATALDVTDAELALTVARTDYARALHGYMLAKARVLSVMNAL